MELKFRQTGGFVGVDRGVTVKTAGLPANLRTAAESLINRDVAAATSSPLARDQAHYHLSIEGDGQRRELRFDDETIPAQLTALIDHLRSQSRPLPPE